MEARRRARSQRPPRAESRRLAAIRSPAIRSRPSAFRHPLTAIRSPLSGRPVLLLSHRFSGVRTADRIHVVGGARVAAAGTHEELMAAAGRDAELFTVQAAAYADASAAALPEQS